MNRSEKRIFIRASILIGPVCLSTMVAFTGAKSKERKVLS